MAKASIYMRKWIEIESAAVTGVPNTSRIVLSRQLDIRLYKKYIESI